MSDHPEDEKLMNHCYDGIQELDNDLPTWWVLLFYIGIVFALAYFVWYEMLGEGPSQEKEYEIEMAIAAEAQKNRIANIDTLTPSAQAVIYTKMGKAIFESKCVACHGAGGKGIIGPNLTDSHFIHGSSRQDMEKVIINGVPMKGMTAWKGIISDFDIKAVSYYVDSLKGTFAEGGKAPQGTEAGEPVSTTATAEKAPEPSSNIVAPVEEKLEKSAVSATDLIAKGKVLFAAKTCAICHGDKGQGMPGMGQNLTDLFMVNGSTKEDIRRVILEGSKKNPMMIAFRAQLTDSEADALVEYIWSITGTNVKGRGAEGEAFTK